VGSTPSDNLRNSARFVKSKANDQVLVLLMQPIYASGIFMVNVVAGELETGGYRLQTGETREIFGIKHYPSQNLTPIGQPTEVDWNTFASNFSEKRLAELQSLYNPEEHAIIVLEKLSSPNSRITSLTTYMPEVLFKRISSGALRGCEYMLQTTFHPTAKCPLPLRVDPEWDAIHIEEPSSRVLIVGGKNAGKSTLAQNLINRNVRKFGRMLLIDLDIGQPIVNVSQTVSATVLDAPILGAGECGKVEYCMNRSSGTFVEF
jgi:polynucleotide 5'-hydroxyl-kinase GRC3/NOL9